MPEMDGYEVCRNLRELPEFALTPILMLTGLSADEDKIKGYHVGADDFLTKPFSPKVFRERVKNIIDRSGAKKPEPPAPPPPAAGPAPTAPEEVPPAAAQPAASSPPAVRTLPAGQDVFQAPFGGAGPPRVNILPTRPIRGRQASSSRCL